MNPIGRTIDLKINEPTDRYGKNTKFKPPKSRDVFINNNKKNHLQYLSLKNTPMIIEESYDINNNKIEKDISGNKKLFNPGIDSTFNAEDFRKNRNIGEFATNRLYYDNDNKINTDDVYVRSRTYAEDGILYYQKPYLYFRKLIKDGNTNKEVIDDGIIQTDTYINNANQTLYSILSEQPKCLNFYNINQLIIDISNSELLPYIETITEDISKVSILKTNFEEIYDLNLSDKLNQYRIKYESDDFINLKNNINNSVLKFENKLDIRNIFTKTTNINNFDISFSDIQQYKDISKNNLLSKINTSELILYWSFDNVYPRNKNFLVDKEQNISKIFQPFDYRNKISYLKNIKTSNLLPRIEKINIYARKSDKTIENGGAHFNALNKNNITPIQEHIKYGWIQILSINQVERDSYTTAIKISKNKIYENINNIIEKEIETYENIIGSQSEKIISKREILGNFLINNKNIFNYLDTVSEDSSFYFSKNSNGNYVDNPYNFLPYYMKDLNKSYMNDFKTKYENDISNNTGNFSIFLKDYFNINNNFQDVLNHIFESTFDIKIVPVNNAAVDLMEDFLGDGNRLEITNYNLNTLIYYNLSFESGFEPSLPKVTLDSSNNENSIFLHFKINIPFIESKQPWNMNETQENNIYSISSGKTIEYIEYAFIEKETKKFNDIIDISNNFEYEISDFNFYDTNGVVIDISNIEYDNNGNPISFYSIESYNSNDEYILQNNSFWVKENSENPGTLFMIKFEKKVSLGFIKISGYDYNIRVWIENSDEQFNYNNDNNLLTDKNGIYKNPDDFYFIDPSLNNYTNSNEFKVYDANLEYFQKDIRENIANNFSNVYYNDFKNDYETNIQNIINSININTIDTINRIIFDFNKNNETNENFIIKPDDISYNTIENELNISNISKTTLVKDISNIDIIDIIQNNLYKNIINLHDENITLFDKKDDLLTEEDKNIFNKYAKHIYDFSSKKSSNTYIFEILKYRAKNIKKFKINNENNNEKININIDQNIQIINYLDNSTLYEDIYIRATNNNKDENDFNIVPSLFPQNRQEKYIKIWKKIKNTEFTKTFDSFNSIKNTIDNSENILNIYNQIKNKNNKTNEFYNNSINTFFKITNINEKKNYKIQDSENKNIIYKNIIYLNKNINDNKYKFLKFKKDCSNNIVEISQFSDEITNDFNNLGNNIDKKKLFEINVYLNNLSNKNTLNGFKQTDTYSINENSELQELEKIFNIFNVYSTKDEMRRFFIYDVSSVNVNNLNPSENIKEIRIKMNSPINNFTQEQSTSLIEFYLDDLNAEGTIENINIELENKHVSNFKLFGLNYIDYIDFSKGNINFKVELKNIFGKCKILNSLINDYLILNFSDSLNIVEISGNNTDGDEIDSYEFKYNNINNINNNELDFYDFKLDGIIHKNNDFIYKVRFINNILNNNTEKFEIINTTYKIENNYTYLSENINPLFKNINLNVKINNFNPSIYGEYIFDENTEKFYSLFFNKLDNKNAFYTLNGIKINSDTNKIIFNNNNDYNLFFDISNNGSGFINNSNPGLINYNNFKNAFNNGTISFKKINKDFENPMRNNINVNNYNNEFIETSLMCQVIEGKLANQDINFDPLSVFNRNIDESENYSELELNNTINDYYLQNVKTKWSNSIVPKEIEQRNLKWIILNNELYYNLLFDPLEEFRNNKTLFKNVNETIKNVMKDNGGLIYDKYNNPTGFYLSQIFRREPMHRYLIIFTVKDGVSVDEENISNTNYTFHSMINIGKNSYWGRSINAKDFYETYSNNQNELINASSQSSNKNINSLFYKTIENKIYNPEVGPIEQTNYIFNKCWSNPFYHFIKQTKEIEFEFEKKYKHFYIFGF